MWTAPTRPRKLEMLTTILTMTIDPSTALVAVELKLFRLKPDSYPRPI